MIVISVTVVIITTIICGTVISSKYFKHKTDISNNESNINVVQIRQDLCTIHELAEEFVGRYNCYNEAPEDIRYKYSISHGEVEQILNRIYNICTQYIDDKDIDDEKCN